MKIIINGESVDISKSGVSIDAYTTEDDWYVRKYSDGYVEMMKKIYAIVPSSSWKAIASSLYLSKSIVVPQVFPFALVKKYYENCVLMGCDWWGGFVQSTGDKSSDSSLMSNDYSLVEYGQPSRDLSVSVGLYVAGVWKNSSLLSENSIDFVSMPLSATSGEVSI